MSSTPTTNLLTPLAIREITLRNRIAVSPMCQYSSEDGFANDWHLVHLGSRAVGGAAAGLHGGYRGGSARAYLAVRHGHLEGGACRVSVTHHALYAQSGRGGGHPTGARGPQSEYAAAVGRRRLIPESEGGWQSVAPSAMPFRDGDPAPHALSKPEIHTLIDALPRCRERALSAGFDVVEIHGAHGYLLHDFFRR